MRNNMQRTTKDPEVGLVLGMIVFTLTACGSTSGAVGSPSSADSQSLSGSRSSNSSQSTSPAATHSSAGAPDPLEGTWQSNPFTAADVDAIVRPQFSGSAVDAWERMHGCSPKPGQTWVQILHFAGGQLVISSAVNGGPAREGWTGSYVVQDSDTFKAGGDQLYITVDFKIRGDRLFTDLIKDGFPDHTPWSDAQDGAGASKLNGVIGKPLADTMCAVEIYETTPFTRIG
jgi:hypothetical protein